MEKFKTQIYPPELILVPDDGNGQEVPYLDMKIRILNYIISTSLFDKRDNFNFPIVNFPVLSGNIPIKGSYGVFTGELVRYARICTFFKDFKLKTLKLISKLKKQFFTEKLLIRTYKTFCENHILLIQKFGPQIISFWKTW